jgi:hypothetical protein
MGQGISLDEALAISLALPEVERRPYGDDAISLRVRGKGFAYLNEVHRRATLKAMRDEHDALVASQPEVFSTAWSSGRFVWVRMLLGGVDRGEYAELITEAWRFTAPKRLVAAYDDQRLSVADAVGRHEGRS